MSTSILSTHQDGVLTLTLNRPTRKNALTLSMYEELAGALNASAVDPKVRVVVITGAGRMFTSGNDLQDFMNSPPTSSDTPVFYFMRALLDFPKPLIAGVDGPAVGIGTTMLLHCDFVYATEEALFQMPFIRLGLVPEAGSSYLLPLMLGQRRAAELLMLGDRFTAEQARTYGVINDVVPADQLSAKVTEKAEALSRLPPEAMRHSKALLKAPFKAELERVMRVEGEIFIERLRSPETAEAITAFFEKRTPDFSAFS